MHSSPKISVIIPAHNCGKSLAKAIKSIPNDSRIEIIIVENGSTDNTPVVAKQLTSDRNNVSIIQSPLGVSAARNEGIVASRGQKIMFLDADDYFLPNLTEFLKKLVPSDLDIFSFESGSSIKNMFTVREQFSGNELTNLISKMLTFPTDYLTVWGKVFDGQIIRDHHLLFPTDLRLSEDSYFMINYLSYCQRVTGHSTLLYHYSRNNDSTVRTFNKQTIIDYTKSLMAVKVLVERRLPFLLHDYYKYGLMQLNLIGVHGIFNPQNIDGFFMKTTMLKKVIHQKIFAECLEKVPFSELGSIKFIAIILIKLHLFFGAGLVFVARSVRS